MGEDADEVLSAASRRVASMRTLWAEVSVVKPLRFAAASGGACDDGRCDDGRVVMRMVASALLLKRHVALLQRYSECHATAVGLQKREDAQRFAALWSIMMAEQVLAGGWQFAQCCGFER